MTGAFREFLIHEEVQASQSADWRRGRDKRGEVQTLGLNLNLQSYRQNAGKNTCN